MTQPTVQTAESASKSASFDPTMSQLAYVNVGKSYGDKVAVKDVSFEVRSGEVLGLLGPNGAGKTSLIRILMDIIRPSQGEVWLFGEPLNRRFLDRVGYLPEERGLYKKLKVIDVLVYFGRLKGLSRRHARQKSLEWLQKVELPEVADWRVERLSKGMSQKVQIAGTLLSEPDLCVLDEPFSGLDPVNTRLIKQLIQDRRTRGQTTILSTHQMDMVEELCDRVAMIHEGHLVVYGEVEEVRREYTPLAVRIDHIGEPPEVQGVVRCSEMKSEPGSLASWRLELEAGTNPSHVLERLVSQGCSPRHFELLLASMEDIFVQIVQGDDEAFSRESL